MKTHIHIYIFFIILSFGKLTAQSFEANGINYNVINTNEVEVKSKTGCYSGDITIPATVDYMATTYNVTAIGNSAFYTCDGLTNVTLPNSITEIKAQAFLEAENLATINFPSSITTIGSYAFMRCYKLESIDLSLTTVSTLGAYAFTRCESATSVSLPSTMTSIGNYNFYYCKLLTSIDIPSSVNAIGTTAFSYSGLTSITIPDGVTAIEARTFEVCRDLEVVNIPSSVTLIGDTAFYLNYSLSEFNIDVVSPISISANVFESVNKSTCVINVPSGSESAYASAPVWQDFGNINTLSITEIVKRNSLKIYPNPTSNSLYVSGLKQDEAYSIYNFEGKQLVNGVAYVSSEINVENLAKGMYILKFKKGNVIKFIKH